MINKIIQLSLNNRWIVLIATIVLVVAGLLEARKLSIDAVPDITNNQVQIITTAPSYAAQDIERKVTFPIEQACSNIAGIQEMRSFSRFGLSLITIVFDDDVDIYWARQQVAERLQKVQTDIPAEIGKPELAPVTTGLGEIYQYILRPAKGFEHRYSLMQLREIQDWIVRRQLLGIQGVAEVSSFGGLLKQYEICLNPHQLSAYGLSISNVMEALEKNNQNTGSAYIEKHSTAYFIRTEGLITNIKDIEEIVVKTNENGIPVQIRDIGKVCLSAAPRYGSLLYTSQNGDDQYEVVGGIVMMLKNENSNKVVKRVKEKIKEIQKTLPEGVIIDPFLDRTKMVSSTIRTAFKNLMEGALIVIFVLVMFLGNIRYGLLVATIIPLSMLFAVIMMNVFNISGNLMSLGALDFGLIVDGAVIIVEAVLYQVSQLKNKNKLKESDANELVYQTSSRMMNAAVFGQIIILIVYLPVLYFKGIEGKMFRPMAQVVMFALTGAFILSVTYVPVMCSWLVQSGNISHFHWSDKMMLILEKMYMKLFKRFFRKSVVWITGMIVLFGISILVLIRLGGEFMPVLEEGDFAVETRLITGSGLQTTIEYCKKASYVLAKEFPDEVEKVVSKIGSAEIPTDPMPIENADIMVILRPVPEWKKARTFDELAEKMQKKLSVIPGLSTSFQYPVQMRFNELIAGAKQDVVCKIFGENIDTLASLAHNVSAIVSKIDGVEGVYEEPVYGQPQIVIRFNRDKLAQYNISVEEANRMVKAVVAGNIVGQVYENERKFDIVVRLDSSYQKIEDLQQLLIPNGNGQFVRLQDIAEIKIHTDVNQIQREKARRRIIVGFNVRGKDVESVIKELNEKIRSVSFPSGYFVEYGGSFENLKTAKERLMITVPIALGLIFIMLYLSFSSIPLALLIYSTIPMSAIGGIFFLYMREMPFSVSAGVGFIALFGIAVLNGLVLISEFQQNRKSGLQGLKVIISGIRNRLRPVLMTTTVASLGFLPMFLNTDIGANVQKPLATVVIGGLISSTILTLFIVPVLYYRYILRKKKFHKGIPMMVIFYLLQYPLYTDAQEGYVVNYQMCIDSALKKNATLQKQKIIADYQKELIKTGWNIGKTTLQLQYGQYNGIYNDNAFQIQQNFNFPSVYQQQKKILHTEWYIAELEAELEKKNLQTTVGKLFYDIVVLNEKIRLLQSMDSIYQQNLRMLDIQFQKGNISSLEKNALGNVFMENQFALSEIIHQKQRYLLLLQILTGIKPIKDIIYEKALVNSETFTVQMYSFEDHPLLLIDKEKIHRQNHKVKLEKLKLLPEIFLGYTNQSLMGWGTDNVYYPISRRFQYFQVGIDVPLFFSTYTRKINAEQKLIRYYDVQYAFNKEVISSEYNKLYQQYQLYSNILKQYESTVLPNAKNIRITATFNYLKGNISYTEWANYITQSVKSENDYLNYVQLFNHTIFDMYYYLQTNTKK